MLGVFNGSGSELSSLLSRLVSGGCGIVTADLLYSDLGDSSIEFSEISRGSFDITGLKKAVSIASTFLFGPLCFIARVESVDEPAKIGRDI